jgi:hypothetical protein
MSLTHHFHPDFFVVVGRELLVAALIAGPALIGILCLICKRVTRGGWKSRAVS